MNRQARCRASRHVGQAARHRRRGVHVRGGCLRCLVAGRGRVREGGPQRDDGLRGLRRGPSSSRADLIPQILLAGGHQDRDRLQATAAAASRPPSSCLPSNIPPTKFNAWPEFGRRAVQRTHFCDFAAPPPGRRRGGGVARGCSLELQHCLPNMTRGQARASCPAAPRPELSRTGRGHSVSKSGSSVALRHAGHAAGHAGRC